MTGSHPSLPTPWQNVRMIGARGFPLRLILSLGAMGWGSGQIPKLFRRRRRRRPILTKSHQGFWILEMLLLDQSPMWNW